jgi:hypothetical protein
MNQKALIDQAFDLNGSTPSRSMVLSKAVRALTSTKR